MSCKHYKKALIEAAATGAALPFAFRDHLEACAHCRSMFAAEKLLFSAIDSTIRARANTEMPSSLMSRVQNALSKEGMTRPKTTSWALAPAGALLAMMAVLLSLRHSEGVHRPETTPIPIASSHGVPTNEAITSGATRRASRSRRAFLRGSYAPGHELQVLIQPGQEEVLLRYYKKARFMPPAKDNMPEVQGEPAQELLAIDRIEVAELEIQHLGDAVLLTRQSWQ